MPNEDNAPWHNEDWLRQKYWEEGNSLVWIANKFDISHSSVRYWMDKHGIETRKQGHYYDSDAKHKDPEYLRKQYWKNGKSLEDIGDELEISPSTVKRWMDRLDIPRRSLHPSLQTNHNGYVIFQHRFDGEHYNARIHRLLAVAMGKLPASELWNSDLDVHHENNIPWDNRPDNIRVVSHSKHLKEHSYERDRDNEGNFA